MAAGIARQIVAALGGLEGIPAEVRYGALADTVPALSVLSEDGEVRDREYIDGSFITSFRFAIHYKLDAEASSAQRMAADEQLIAIADGLEAAAIVLEEGQTLTELKRTSNPVYLGSTEGGQEVWGVDLAARVYNRASGVKA